MTRRFPEKFEAFYSKSYNGRKLTWMHNLCNADIRLNYLKKPYSVTMGTFQMAILLGFNAVAPRSTLTLRELHEFTQLAVDKELIKQVQSLVDAKLLLIVNANSEMTEAATSTVSLDCRP